MSCQAMSWTPFVFLQGAVYLNQLALHKVLFWATSSSWCGALYGPSAVAGSTPQELVVLVMALSLSRTIPAPDPSLAVHGPAALMANLERQAAVGAGAAWPGNIWLCLQWSVLRGARAPSPTCCSSQLCQLSSRRLPFLDIMTFGFFPSLPDPCPDPFPEGAVSPCCPSPCPHACLSAPSVQTRA